MQFLGAVVRPGRVTDTLALSASLTYTRHVVDTLRSQGSATVLYSHVSSGTYADTGTSITFTDGVTDASVTGTIVGGVITITTVENGFNVTGVFDKRPQLQVSGESNER